ncbi:MAG: PAS domain-containing protein [Cyclobacteriaceae bacterium]|nr:PAS domain-containing protein [Cyclobacteriaceae bacterium]
MATKQELQPFFAKIYSKADNMVDVLVGSYFLFGIFIAFFYDTWIVGIGVGFLCLVLYYGTKYFFKGKTINQYIVSLVLGVFMAQYIYQMHGMFEMHFTAFIAIISLSAYQNKYIYIPLTLFIVIHHSTFAYVQYLGVINDIPSYQQIYFTQLDYMDFQTFLFHAGIVTIGVIISSVYAHNAEKRTITNAGNILQLQAAEKINEANINFANEIDARNFSYEYKVKENDQLGATLMNMRNNLIQSTEREEHEKFINVGVAGVGEILRNFSDDLEKLSYEVVEFLVKYLKFNQGGIFVLNDTDDNDQYLELKGCYAYDRKKFLQKRVDIGDGLVGQTYLEKEVTHLKNIPDDYINITSGLGKATPKTIVIVPIKNNEIIEGVLELASFSDLAEFEIEFLKKIGENIAVAINSAKINTRTKDLYTQSQQQTEELRAQEEEVRQNMEELAATQEQSSRLTLEMESQLNAINNALLSVEINMDQTVHEVNENFTHLTGLSTEAISRRKITDIITNEKDNISLANDLFHQASNGSFSQGEITLQGNNGEKVYLKATFNPINNEQGNVIKILLLAFDISENKSNLSKMTEMTEKVKKSAKETAQKSEAIISEYEKDLKEKNKIIDELEKNIKKLSTKN